MKRINFNIKDRKILTLGLCLILVCVFTLTIAYAALNAVLTIQGTAQVSSADWDIHLANPKVTSGSATTNVPQIKTNSTMDFSTTLNMPGDFYEFTVDVVNSGSIDAMIENVIKNPELDASQKKYLNYEVAYQNGESITTKQTLSHGTTMPSKVRIEYRKDLNASDLPTGQVVLDLSLTLEYIQSDGTGSTVTNNGVYNPVSANGSIEDIGTIVTIGSEQFYTIGTEGDNVKLLSMYNLYVGGVYDYNTQTYTPYGDEATGIQDSRMLGHKNADGLSFGATIFSETVEQYNGSVVEKYVNNYKTYLEEYGIVINEARLVKHNEAVTDPFSCDYYFNNCSGDSVYSVDYSFWVDGTTQVWAINKGYTTYSNSYKSTYLGVRPVIVISKDYFN